MSLPVYHARSNALKRNGRSSISPPGSGPAGFSFVWEDQFTGGALNADRWNIRTDGTWGHAAPQNRIQDFNAANVVVGAGSTGSTGGTSLRLRSLREGSSGSYIYTGGYLETKAGHHMPRYFYSESRMKIPHGQGIWPAWWSVHTNGGSNELEIDMMEYFHSQVPGRATVTLHGVDNAGTFRSSFAKMSPHRFFEVPTYTPEWQTFGFSCTPESGTPDSPTTNIRYKAFHNGTEIWSYLDTQGLHWSSLGTVDESHKIYLQGAQIGGQYNGHPEDPLGQSRWLNSGAGGCTISGTYPNSCATTSAGYSIIAPDWTNPDPATTYEVDYIKVWKYVG